MNTKHEPGCEITGLSVSVVAYHPDQAQFSQTLRSLLAAYDDLTEVRPDVKLHVLLIDNGGMSNMRENVSEIERRGAKCTMIVGQGNVGYGRGHNLAIERVVGKYHLVLNPDIDLERDALTRALEFFDGHPEAGLLTPLIGDETGHIQYLCRRYPTVMDLFIRGFLPTGARRMFARRLARYEMRDEINEQDIVWDPPIVSGCFMFFRTIVLKTLSGFDPRYFLYFEDYDLSLRTHEVARIAYCPAMRVRHHGGGAARKGFAHIRMFVTSAYQFFNRFGWKWL